MITCPQCSNQNDDGAGFCDNCGASLSGAAPVQAATPAPTPAAGVAGSVCPSCNASVMPGEMFCENCGASLSSPQPIGTMPPSVPSTPPPTPAPVAPPQVVPAAGALVCTECAHQNPAGHAYCERCGASLQAATPPMPIPVPQPPQQQWPSQQPGVQAGISPRLVVPGTGASISLSGKSEYLIGREDPVSGVFPEVDMTPHGGEEGGVSRQHAKITVVGNQCMIEDLNSVNFTYVNNQKLEPNQAQPLSDGAQIRLGRVVLTFHAS